LWFYDAHGLTEIGFARRIFADFARLAHMSPALLHAVWVDHVRALEAAAVAIPRSE